MYKIFKKANRVLGPKELKFKLLLANKLIKG